MFDTIEEISRTPDGERTKTVVYITHRLATARRADKIAMMENGVSVKLWCWSARRDEPVLMLRLYPRPSLNSAPTKSSWHATEDIPLYTKLLSNIQLPRGGDRGRRRRCYFATLLHFLDGLLAL